MIGNALRLAHACTTDRPTPPAPIITTEFPGRTWAAFNAGDHPEGIRGSVSRYLGLLATTLKRFDEAQSHFEDAIALNERMGARPWLAHTQSDYARMLLAHDGPGDRERAQQFLDQALATYRELGMESYAANASDANSTR